MFKRNWWLSLIALMIVPLGANAQSPSVTEIPVMGRGVNIAISPDGKMLAAAPDTSLYEDAADPANLPIHLFDLSTGKETGQLAGDSDYVGGLAFTPDGKTLASYQNNGVIDLWDVASKTMKHSFIVSGPSRERLMQFLPDGQRIAMNQSGAVPSVTVWDSTSGNLVNYLLEHFETYAQFDESLSSGSGSPDSVSAFAVAPDGKSIVAGTAFDAVWLWNLADNSGKKIVDSGSTLPYFDIRQINFSSDGSQVFYFLQHAKELHSWNLTTNSAGDVVELDATMAAVSPDGKTIVSAKSKDDGVYFEPITGSSTPTEIKLPKGVPQNPTLSFTADGSHVIVNGSLNGDGEVQALVDEVAVPATS